MSLPSFRPGTSKAPGARFSDRRLTEKASRPAEITTGWPPTLAALDTLPDSFKVEPLGRKISALPSVTMPMAVERTLGSDLTMPATLPSAVRRRETLSPGLMSPMVSQALWSTSNLLPATWMVRGVLGVGAGSV